MKTPLYKKILNMGAKLGISKGFFLRLYDRVYPVLSFFKYGNPHFFYSVSMEISTYCNRKCEYCPNALYDTPEYYMDPELFRKIISDLRRIRFRGSIGYNHYNEPLLDPRIVSLIREAVTALPFAYHFLFSNGDYLTMEMAQQLVEAGISQIHVTNHNRNPEPLRKKLQPVLDSFPSIITYKENMFDSPTLTNRGGEMKHINNPRTKCPNGRQLLITWTGDVILCCEDYHRKYVLGNIREQTAKEIWNSKKNRTLRRQLRKKDFRLPICKACMGISEADK